MIRALTPDLLAAAERGLQRRFVKLYDAVDTSAWDGLYTEETSDRAGENYPALGAAPAMAKFTGTRTYGGVRTDGFYVENDAYDAGFEIPRADIERDQLGKYDAVLQELAERAKRYPQRLVETILANCESTSLAKCWDNKALISATHGKDKGASQSNIISASGVDTLAHVQTDIAQGLAAMAGWKDDKGEYVGVIAPNVAIYPSGNYALANFLRVIIQARQALDSPTYDDVITRAIPSPLLSGNDWYLAAAGGAKRPFGFQTEKPPTLETEFDFDRKVMKVAVELRGAAFCGDWMRIVQINNT